MKVAEQDGRHAIATRNRAAIMEAAFAVIARDPDAGMNTIADGAGVGRATLYRHFPAREDLLEALRARAREQGKAALVAARPDEGDPIEALQRLVETLFTLGTRHRVLFPPGERPPRARREQFFEPITRTLIRARDAGMIDADVCPQWLTTVVASLLGAAGNEIEAGRLRPQDAPSLVVRQLLDGARPPN